MADKDIKVIIETLLESKKFKAGLTAMNNDAKKSSTVMSGFKKILAGLSVAFVATKILAGFKEVIKVGKEFEQAIANVASVSGDSREELEKLAREAGVNTVYSARQAADAMYFLASAGLAAKDMSVVLTPTLNFAAASQMDLAKATDMVICQLKVFKADMKDAEKFTDIMATTVSSSNTDFNQLGNALSYSSSIASTLGISFKDLNAVLATMAEKGIKGGRAGTQLRMALTKLIDPTSQAQKVLEKYGITQLEINNLLDDPIELFKLLSPAMQDAQDATKILGVRQQDLIGIIKDGLPVLDSMKDKISNAGGAAQRMADVQIDTLGGSLKLLNSAWEEQAILISKKFEPALTSIVKGVTELIKPEKTLDQVTTDLVDITREYKQISDELANASANLTKEETRILKVRQATLKLDIIKHMNNINNLYDEQKKKLPILNEQLRLTNESLEETSEAYMKSARVIELAEKRKARGYTLTNKQQQLYNDALLRSVPLEHGLHSLRTTGAKLQVKIEKTTSSTVTAIDKLAFGLANQLITKKDLLGVDKELIAKAEERAKTINIETELLNENVASIENKNKKMITLADEAYKTLNGKMKEQLATEKENYEKGLISLEVFEARKKAIKAAYGAEVIAQVADLAKQAFDVTGQFMANEKIRLDQKHEADLAAFDKNSADELAILENKFAQGLITENEYNTGKDKLSKDRLDLEHKMAIESAKGAVAAAKLDKAAALFSIAASTAMGIMGIWGAPPYHSAGIPGKIVRTAIVGSLGIAQGGAVLSKPLPQIPSFRSGTESTKEGMAMLHDDERIIPKSQNIPGISNQAYSQAAMHGLGFGGGNNSSGANISSTSSTDNTKKIYNFYGIRDISAARNELLRSEGEGAF